ncbi:hypothetical protein R83H12_00785 [Fibrobacteria bacterium R8-3-H12]
MLMMLLILIIPMLIGCASAPRQAEPEPAAECQADEFRGFGVGENENTALSEARSALAGQISSSVNVTMERIVSQRMSNGKEYLNSGYESRTTIESFLPNAQDARIVRSKRNGNKINIVVCMSRSDAAKGFLERQRLLADSLGLASGTELNTEHPKQKNEAWRKTQMLYNDFARIQNMLEGWGVKSPYLADELYSKAREDYRNYCQGAKVFWQDAGNECSNAVFAVLSKKIKIEKSKCSGGLNMKFNCLEKCKSYSYGIECSYEPSLSIESCGGQSYSLLKTQTPATSTDTYNEAKAREKLAESLTKAVFLNEWKKEIKEWMPQCTD